ncbi:hypothetical protein DYB25_009689 [Aphanomyces astaci]|uniref:B box-type domain-containing protein n=1 Tax=Aphanomyces astaci TaxID=112090 RepID=A0A397ALI3_APHAT|nr:hypothetical protein DYB25_009689 [Aphanomyces astaci]
MIKSSEHLSISFQFPGLAERRLPHGEDQFWTTTVMNAPLLSSSFADASAKMCCKCVDRATHSCVECDLLYCLVCSDQRHSKGSFQRHTVTTIAPALQSTQRGASITCEECTQGHAVLHCSACELAYCSPCSKDIHRSGALQHHSRDCFHYLPLVSPAKSSSSPLQALSNNDTSLGTMWCRGGWSSRLLDNRPSSADSGVGNDGSGGGESPSFLSPHHSTFGECAHYDTTFALSHGVVLYTYFDLRDAAKAVQSGSGTSTLLNQLIAVDFAVPVLTTSWSGSIVITVDISTANNQPRATLVRDIHAFCSEYADVASISRQNQANDDKAFLVELCDSRDVEPVLANMHNAIRGSFRGKFAVSSAEVAPDTRTTLMIRHIPNKYTQAMLLAEINGLGHHGAYDFFYLPIDFKNKCNMGYAFVNFMTTDAIIPFYKAFNGRRWRCFNSDKVCAITYARLQGKAAMVYRFQNSSLLDKHESYRPLVFKSSGPDKGAPELVHGGGRHDYLDAVTTNQPLALAALHA